MSIEISADDANLAQLQDVPVAAVLQSIDQGLVHLPTYRELYYRWERQQWQSQEIDFIADRIQWEDMSDEERDSHVATLATFFQGEACVTDALAPYVLAAPEEEMRIYLTTQLVDEARHTVFFDRFFSEVLEIDAASLEEALSIARQHINAPTRHILLEALPETANRIRQEPHNLAYLLEGVVLYHMIVEGTMALAGQRALLERFREEHVFPALCVGMTALTRDESRHVLFGVRFLRDMLQRDPSCARVVRDALSHYAPIALEGLTPAAEMIQRMQAEGDDPWKAFRYGRTSLGKKLKVIGLEVALPEVPTSA
ncbi:MAG TPA: ribonucleotide-diphosphate reductase subunit beta [Ktedonobacteraceae bacterium]|nr:ribonucleotide-diphosphate reductase subunit beta [Ktedonobacteraceae bacterium]